MSGHVHDDEVASAHGGAGSAGGVAVGVRAPGGEGGDPAGEVRAHLGHEGERHAVWRAVLPA